MAEGCIYIYTGDGRGKSPAAIGRAVQAAVEGKRVVIIQFLKGKGLGDSDFLRRMEPEIKLFRFEKSDACFADLTPEQQAVVDECGQKAVQYERYINRSGDEEIMERWQSKNGVTITNKEDMDIDSFKKAVEGVDEWFVEQLKDAGYDDGQELVDLFEK